jgi:hypothetical protein
MAFWSSFGGFPGLRFGAIKPPVEPLKVAVDRGAVDPKPAGGLTSRGSSSNGLYYLGTQVYRISLHIPMMSAGAIFLQGAVQQVQRVERLVGGLTQVRRVVSGYEMTTESYPTMLTLAPIPFLWL